MSIRVCKFNMICLIGFIIFGGAVVMAGPNVGGGGSQVDGMAFELFLKKNKFDPKAEGLGGEKELEGIGKQLPSLAKRMAKIYSKKWVRVDSEDIGQLTKAESGVPLVSQTVIYQTAKFVFVDQEWMKTASAEDKSILLQHEYWQSIRIENNNDKNLQSDDEDFVMYYGGKIPASAIPEITYETTQEGPLTDKQLQKLVRDMKFGSYGTADEVAKVLKDLKKAQSQTRETCKLKKGQARVEKLQAIGSAYEKTHKNVDYLSGLGAEYTRQESKFLPNVFEVFVSIGGAWLINDPKMLQILVDSSVDLCKQLKDYPDVK